MKTPIAMRDEPTSPRASASCATCESVTRTRLAERLKEMLRGMKASERRGRAAFGASLLGGSRLYRLVESRT